ncbi:SMC-Scp complex subunit ScpB [Chloroherpeton thalassium]|uniref:SMC-Scp complex subunit ScpB n=1 Tax=Chloroherpeton thalassium TaxID=100716 RepID=UPI001FE14E1B|nr:SMC-Scp complex subunit ScpB [Chloroherpeton thalassium]
MKKKEKKTAVEQTGNDLVDCLIENNDDKLKSSAVQDMADAILDEPLCDDDSVGRQSQAVHTAAAEERSKATKKIITHSASIDSHERLDIKQQLEALIFSSDESLSAKMILAAFDDARFSEELIDELVQELNHDYEKTGRVFRIRKIAGGFRFLTEPEFHFTIQKLMQPKLQRRISQAGLETLAIVAYKQPISKAEIEAIRGTNSDYVVRMLLERNLVKVSGRAETVGKPLLYSTTKEFLDYFSLSSLSDLPKPREIQELMKEAESQSLLNAELEERVSLKLANDAKEEAKKQRPKY